MSETYDFGYVERMLRRRWSGLNRMIDVQSLDSAVSPTGRTPERPHMQNFPGTSAHVLEVTRADGTLADGIVCMHCGTRFIRQGEPDHLCIAAVFDWLEAFDGEYRKRSLEEVVNVMNELGV